MMYFSNYNISHFYIILSVFKMDVIQKKWLILMKINLSNVYQKFPF